MPDGGASLFEWAKLLVSLATPLAVVAVGYFVNVRLRAIEERRWLNQKVIEKRLALFESMAPKLNDLLCYFAYVGHWKEVQPPRVIALKRELDREMYVHEALFPTRLRQDYQAFMEACFKMYGGSGTDARLKTGYGVRKQVAASAWKAEWEPSFLYAGENDDLKPEAKAEKWRTYQALMASFADALGITRDSEAP